jgi:hydrogenase nickel incorporation protein HypA/HybF
VHEASITESLLSLALEKAQEAKAAKITRINLVVGELSGIVPDCVRFYFDVLKKDTPADSAVLSFETRPTRIRCRKCNKEFNPVNEDWACPDCHEISMEIISGRECYMESIEVE